MAVTTFNFPQIVSQMATAIQASAKALTKFTSGSILRAICEAVAGVALWLQALILQVLAISRAATSTGTDLDSWCADFGFARLPAVTAIGRATAARFVSTLPAFVPVGAQFVTADGTQTFAVIADTNNTGFNVALNGYPIAAAVASVDVTVQAVNAGAQGNIAAGTLSQIASAIVGIDTVNNAANYNNGIDAETDIAVRARFVLFINGLSKGTKAAIQSAILGVQQGLNFTLDENFDYPGTTPDNGNFFVVFDDGSGTPPGSLLTAINTAVDLVRPFTSRFDVHNPTVVNLTILLTITAAPGFTKSALQPIVQAAVLAFVNGLGLGNSLSFTRVAQVAYDATPGIANVSAVTVNGGTADIAASVIQTLKTALGSVTVS